ncbi:Uncharacterised protein [uncultured archaeon]|nr:Uncharacterised protein [uncultured archaeon]
MMARIGKTPFAIALLLAVALLIGQLNSSFFSDLFGTPRSISCTGTTPGTTVDWKVWIGFSFIGLFLGTAIVSLGYIFSGAFSSAQYNEFLKGKLWEIIETAALLSIFSLSFIGLSGYGEKNIKNAQAYSTLIQNTIVFDFGVMLAASMATGFIVNINPQFKVPGAAFISLGFQITPMFKPIIDALNLTMQLITTAVGMWSAQGLLLCFAKTQMLALLLPIGFFLRALGVKGGGNALIGISLAVYFAYPYLIIIMGEVVTSHMANMIAGSQTPHLLSTCSDKPICCLQSAGTIPGPGDDYLPNGKRWNDPDPAIASQYRIKTDAVLSGGFAMSLGSASTGANACMYNNMLARAYKATFGDIVNNLTTWGVVGTMGAAGALAFLFNYMNISWLTVFLMVPLSFFVIHSVEEMLYFVFIVTILMPLFILFITLTLAREISKALGTEIDLSSLEKLV